MFFFLCYTSPLLSSIVCTDLRLPDGFIESSRAQEHRPAPSICSSMNPSLLSVGIPRRKQTQVCWDLIDSSEAHQEKSVLSSGSPEVCWKSSNGSEGFDPELQDGLQGYPRIFILTYKLGEKTLHSASALWLVKKLELKNSWREKSL